MSTNWDNQSQTEMCESGLSDLGLKLSRFSQTSWGADFQIKHLYPAATAAHRHVFIKAPNTNRDTEHKRPYL